MPVAGNELRQVLLNLLLNAVNASKSGGHVTLSCALVASQLRLEVVDQGSGLPGNLAANLEDGTSPSGGSGLGVAVVRLVQQLQGQVSVDAHPDRGTRIVLELPLTAPEEKVNQ